MRGRLVVSPRAGLPVITLERNLIRHAMNEDYRTAPLAIQLVAQTLRADMFVRMGKRRQARQPVMWVPATELPTAASHPFYARLNQLRLHDCSIDRLGSTSCLIFVKTECPGNRVMGGCFGYSVCDQPVHTCGVDPP
jgi:hypothetical protein